MSDTNVLEVIPGISFRCKNRDFSYISIFMVINIDHSKRIAITATSQETGFVFMGNIFPGREDNPNVFEFGRKSNKESLDNKFRDFIHSVFFSNAENNPSEYFIGFPSRDLINKLKVYDMRQQLRRAQKHEFVKFMDEFLVALELHESNMNFRVSESTTPDLVKL